MIPRPVYLGKLIAQKDKDLVKVITGIRRCGKSVLLMDLFAGWLEEQGIESDRIVKVDLELKDNESLRDADALYEHVCERIGRDGPYYVMIDEVQLAEGFVDVVNSLNKKGCDVYVTGSNSTMLSSEIESAFRGRNVEIRVWPLSFAEYHSWAQGGVRQDYNDYMLYGGMPYVTSYDTREGKTGYLKMLEGTVATRDIVERHNVRNIAAFEAVYDFLCSNIGSIVSANSIAKALRGSGFSSITADTVGQYLSYLTEAFLFDKVLRYDVKGKAYLKTLNKYYIADLGLRNAHMNYRQVEVTHALENIVYLELVRRGLAVDIGKNREKEIDFVAVGDRETYYIQVAYSIADEGKRATELASFAGLDDGYKKIVITMDDDPFTMLENGYRKLNVFDFLLDPESLDKA
ncbi:MAG TPA: AAA family ATPase [Eggerthellaceae bacterium]|nr:AAA family ATPase [Eggerthellaceae bacterium]